MPRLSRLDSPGLLHHVIIRGIERRKIFNDDKDRENFIDRMAILLPGTKTICYALAFMSNHAHFLMGMCNVGAERAQFGALYHHRGQTDEIRMNGLSATHEIALADTSYYAEVTTISPENSTGDTPVVISGQAVDRASASPMPNVPFKLIISLNGFERTVDLLTDNAGAFACTFTPNKNESGVYQVMALHPDLTDRSVQGQFVIQNIGISPAAVNLQMPENYEQTIAITATAGKGTTAQNLRIAYEAVDQPGGVLLQGVHVTAGSPVSIDPEQKIDLPVKIWADNTAASSGKLILKVKSDESGENARGQGVSALRLNMVKNIPYVLAKKNSKRPLFAKVVITLLMIKYRQPWLFLDFMNNP